MNHSFCGLVSRYVLVCGLAIAAYGSSRRYPSADVPTPGWGSAPEYIAVPSAILW
jgi:hypothetical protein